MSSQTAEPLLPIPNRTESFWLSERDPELQNARTSSLPTSADVVVIGSGLAGCMTAYHLCTKATQPLQVVMLEADEFCGSATARNGGHCKPLTYIGYRATAAKYGQDVADQVLRFEEAALGRYADIVAREDIDCDMHVTRAFDMFYGTEEEEAGRKDLQARMADFPESVRAGDIRTIEDSDNLQDVTSMKGARWGVSYPAGHLWPYKLAAGLAKISMRRGLNLQTHTPALGLETTKEGLCNVQTARGNITARTVVLATNAYTPSVLPEFKDRIIPVRGTACSITPPPPYTLGHYPGPLKYSYGIRHSTGDNDYLIPRQGRGRIPGQGDRSIILGGAKSCYLGDLDLWYDNKHDDEEIPQVRKYFETFMRKFFVDWDGNEKGNVDKVWSGVLGYSSDMLPYVGQVPGRPGVFMLAGFTGHGMPRIPGCADAVSDLVLASLSANGDLPQAAVDTFRASIPKPYWLTQERLDANVNIIQASMGQGKKTVEAQSGVSVEAVDEAAMSLKHNL